MNPYPDRFAQLLEEADGPVLDSGSGGRCHHGVVSLEYVWHLANSVQGDGQALPFRDNTFVLCLSQATLEHVPRPQEYVDEVFRVLRPGGLFYAEAAFFQPLHQEPWHFFNMTPEGLAYLCRDFEILESGVMGSMLSWFNWWSRDIRASEILSPSIMQAIRAAMSMLDSKMTPEQIRRVVSGVWLLGRKP